MKAETEQVLTGLKAHAAGQLRAMRAKELASVIGLRVKTVTNALSWLVVEKKHPNVHRESTGHGTRFRYWWEDNH